MAKKTRPDPHEYITNYYGINPKTFEVESVSETRGGLLSKWSKDGDLKTHQINHGRRGRSEVHVAWGLLEIKEAATQFDTNENTKRITDELERKAATMKAEAEKDKPTT
jgi:hypothetical protein